MTTTTKDNIINLICAWDQTSSSSFLHGYKVQWPQDQGKCAINDHIIFTTPTRVQEPLNHQVCGSKVFSCPRTIFKGSKTPSTFKVLIIFKGSRTINSSSVGPRTFSRFLYKARGFMGFFNHFNHTAGPPRVKIYHVTSYGVVGPYPRVSWHHKSMNDHIMDP